MKKRKDTIRTKTKRISGTSLPMIIADLNGRLCGWFEYFKRGDRATFRIINSWNHRRLRTLLRERRGRRGIANVHGADHHRCPNAIFAEHGLLNLQKIHELAGQSCRS